MKQTTDGYFLPENNEEMHEAIEHNTKKAAEEFEKLTPEQQHEQTKKQNKSPRGYARGGLKLDNYIDNVEEFYKVNPFFYDKNQLFWLWNNNEYKYEISDETTIMNLIDEQLGFGGQTVTSKIKSNYLEAFKRVGRKNIPQNPPKTWLQFKNKIVDLETGEEKQAGPKYFFTNPIPWTLGNSEETPAIDKLFNDWQGPNKEILYEVMAYCMLPDYPIHIIVANIGTGRNGKTQYTKLIEQLIGRENTTSAELDSLIKERFESAKLHKKLVCLMGETNFGVMSQTSLLKKLCGGDLISYEYKNKMPFTDVNYAKIIINTNSLPTTADTTDGFFRRWLIINWQNNFEESGKDIYQTIPLKEYPCLAKKCVNKLKTLLQKGSFSAQGSIDERKHKYILASNPIGLFLSERCEQGDSFYVKAKDLYHAYINYLQEKKRRIIKRKEFNQILAEEGYQAEHTQRKRMLDTGDYDFETSYWIDGLRLRNLETVQSHWTPLDTTGQNFLPILPNLPSFYLSSPIGGARVENQGEKGEKGENRLLKTHTGIEFTFTDLEIMIIERETHEIEIDKLISYGVTINQLDNWKSQGLIVENRAGWVSLLK